VVGERGLQGEEHWGDVADEIPVAQAAPAAEAKACAKQLIR
jgi:hypothetical protein